MVIIAPDSARRTLRRASANVVIVSENRTYTEALGCR